MTTFVIIGDKGDLISVPKFCIYISPLKLKYWVVRKVRAAKDLNLINEIKNLNLLRPIFLQNRYKFSGQYIEF